MIENKKYFKQSKVFIDIIEALTAVSYGFSVIKTY